MLESFMKPLEAAGSEVNIPAASVTPLTETTKIAEELGTARVNNKAKAAEPVEQTLWANKNEVKVLHEPGTNSEVGHLPNSESPNTAEQEQFRTRKFQVESKLLALDAGLEIHKQKIQDLLKEMKELESEVQKSVEKREILVNELFELSASPLPFMERELNGSQVVQNNLHPAGESPGDKKSQGK